MLYGIEQFANCLRKFARAMRAQLFILLLLLSSCEAGRKKTHLSAIVKRGSASVHSAVGKLATLVQKSAFALSLIKPPFVYHMDDMMQRLELIDLLWKGEYHEAIGRFTSLNPNVISFFEQQHLHDDAPSRLHELSGEMPRFESVLTQLFRSRSQKLVPIETAALSIRLLHFQCPRSIWTAISFFGGGLVMSRKWTETLIDDALMRDPGCPYPVAGGITGAIFDNFRLACGHGSFSTMDSTGFSLDMTNWATVFIPAIAIPGGSVDIKGILGAGGMFRRDLVLNDFIDSFSIHAPDIVANQYTRWRECLTNAGRGTLWDKEPFASPYTLQHISITINLFLIGVKLLM